jgi:hypothetical protein
MSLQIPAIGDRAEKLCAKCNVERGHVVASVNKRGHINRVECPKCGTRSVFKRGTTTTKTESTQASPAYDTARTYRTGQFVTHPTYGEGEVTALIEPQKIDVLFSDRVRRLVHSRSQS